MLSLFKAIKCGQNQFFGVISTCPATCLNPEVNNACGITTEIEGCFCSPGFVLSSNGSCIPPSLCGCLLPDRSGILPVFF